MEARQILVLGGMGFIGANLSIALAGAGARVVVLDRADPTNPEFVSRRGFFPTEITVVSGDIQTPEVVEQHLYAADVVFDLAGATGHLSSMKHPVMDLDANFMSHVHFLETMRRVGPDIPFVVASTRQVLGRNENPYANDDDDPRPVDVNGVGKLALEHYLRVCGSSWGLKSAILRFPNVYGPHMLIRDSSQGVLGGWIGKALNNEDLVVYGSGLAKRNILYATDACEALIAAFPLVSTEAPAFLVGGEEKSLGEMARSVAVQANVKVRFDEMPHDLRSIDVGSLLVDDSRFRTLSGWQPKVPSAVGMAKTFDFFHGRMELYEH
jgi:UDP-glucose 4-epimerase